MSETVHYIGKLKPTGKRISEYMGDVEIPGNYTLDEYFKDKYYRTAYVIDGLVFEVEKIDYEEEVDIFLATKNDDGTIDFQVKYYNGGCSFDDALDEATENL